MFPSLAYPNLQGIRVAAANWLSLSAHPLRTLDSPYFWRTWSVSSCVGLGFDSGMSDRNSAGSDPKLESGMDYSLDDYGDFPLWFPIHFDLATIHRSLLVGSVI